MTEDHIGAIVSLLAIVVGIFVNPGVGLIVFIVVGTIAFMKYAT